MLCECCLGIFRGSLKTKLKEENPHIHHADPRSFQNAVDDGCFICQRIDGALSEREASKSTCTNLRLQSTYYALRREATKENATKAIILLFHLEAGGIAGGISLQKELRLVQMKDISDILGSHVVCPSSSSHTSLQLALQWTTECRNHHPQCEELTRILTKGREFFPTRLIDVSPTESGGVTEWKLCNTSKDGITAPYMTLSHCWGDSSFKGLTVSTLETMEMGLWDSFLPKTFRDAFVVARHLGIRYIWIDSLCILQNDEGEWKRESSMMRDVYAHSFCNIAATWGQNSKDGCFVERAASDVSPYEIVPEWRDWSHRQCILTDPKTWERQVTNAPLNRRAWVLQERLLAPRVISFGRNQMFWECSYFLASEAFPAPHRPLPILGEQRFKNLDILYETTKRFSGSDGSTALVTYPHPYLPDANFFWAHSLAMYRRCDLSKPEDKLVALSGIAKIVQEVTGDEYCAGLWKEGMARQLLWRVKNSTQANGQPSARPSTYRAPSWSWASLDGEPIGNISASKSSDQKVMARVVEVDIQPLTSDTTGQVQSGHIQAQGVLLKAKTDTALGRIKVGRYALRARLDFDIHPPCHSFHCLLISCTVPGVTSSSEPPIRSLEGILLQRRGIFKRRYTRCGYFHLDEGEAASRVFGVEFEPFNGSVEFSEKATVKTIKII